MDAKRWYAADALTADLTTHHYHLRAASEEEAERRMGKRYPEAVALLVRHDCSWQQVLSGSRAIP